MKKYPLFPSQLGVFLECLAYPDTTQYNLPYHVKIDLCEDADALVDAWKRLICATPTLRIRFEMDGEGNPRQWPEEDMPIDIPVKDMREAEAADYVQGGFVRPFDLLSGEPLFRIEIIKTETQINLLMDFHHLLVKG